MTAKSKISQVASTQPGVKNVNYTLREMFGISQLKENLESGSEKVFRLQSQMSNPKMASSGKFADSALDITQWKDELDNKYLQKTSYTITKQGLVTQQKDFVIETPIDINETI